MPAALKPGSVTAPVFPMRTVPGFAGPSHADARVREGDGGADQRFNIPTPAGSTLLWGDWNRDGAVTPIVFTGGHWVVYDTVIGPTPLPTREFDYGMAGDKPVVGDFNSDGRTDIGVVRGGYLAAARLPVGRGDLAAVRIRDRHRRPASPATGTATAATAWASVAARSGSCSRCRRHRGAKRRRPTPSPSAAVATSG